MAICGTRCLYGIAIALCLGAVVFTQRSAFLFAMNVLYSLLNRLDGTSVGSKWNPYYGTTAQGFFKPLTENEISGNWHSIKPRSGGKIPAAFHEGVLFRIGSNQFFPTRTALHIWEADGLVHAFKFDSEQNAISVASAFMNTPKLRTERVYNQGIYIAGTEDLLLAIGKNANINGHLSAFNKAVKMAKFFLGQFVDSSSLSPFNRQQVSPKGSSRYFHCANTDILQWNGRLFATCEGSVFFEFSLDRKSMTIESLGFTALNDSWPDQPYIAHPVVDPFEGGKLLVIGHDPEKGPEVAVGVIDKEYSMLNVAQIALNHAQEIHDMSSTENYIILHDFNAWFGVEQIRDKGEIFGFEKNASSRFGLVDKKSFINGAVNVKWFEVQPAITFHMAATWEEEEQQGPWQGDRVVTLIGPRMGDFDFNGLLHHNAVRQGKPEANVGNIYEWKLNTATGAVSERVLVNMESIGNPEMPQIHPLFKARKVKYIWFNLIDSSVQGFGGSAHGIIKYDVEKESIVGRIDYDPADGRRGSYEAVFVPKESKDINKVKSEDDGYLVNVIYNDETEGSTLQIFDAKTMDSTPLAIIDLPYRIPGGFHSKFFRF